MSFTSNFHETNLKTIITWSFSQQLKMFEVTCAFPRAFVVLDMLLFIIVIHENWWHLIFWVLEDRDVISIPLNPSLDVLVIILMLCHSPSMMFDYPSEAGVFHINPRFHITSVVWNLEWTQDIPNLSVWSIALIRAVAFPHSVLGISHVESIFCYVVIVHVV